VIHYHGTPITPNRVLAELSGRHFCVSFAAPSQVKMCHQIGQSVMLDNGAFSLWRSGKKTDWPRFYAWCGPWLEYHTTWAVIPDVIDGSEQENDALLHEWPYPREKGAPVWHLHESLERLNSLVHAWPRVCFGSSGQYASVGTQRWHHRMAEAFNKICPTGGPPPAWLHMLRGMSLSGKDYPFASVDSTDIARNHWRVKNGGATAVQKAHRWDSMQCPAAWIPRLAQAVL
jgi:hypothetical protein